MASYQLRNNYYNNYGFIAGSRIIMELALENQPRDISSFVLSGVGLSVTCHLEHLVAATVVNLSCNMLRNLGAIYCLQSVRELNVANNQLTNCCGLNSLPVLETVDLSNNGKLNFHLCLFKLLTLVFACFIALCANY